MIYRLNYRFLYGTYLTLHDEFSVYTTTDEIFNFIDELLENSLSNEFEIYDLCIEKFRQYFTQHLDSLK